METWNFLEEQLTIACCNHRATASGNPARLGVRGGDGLLNPLVIITKLEYYVLLDFTEIPVQSYYLALSKIFEKDCH